MLNPFQDRYLPKFSHPAFPHTLLKWITLFRFFNKVDHCLIDPFTINNTFHNFFGSENISFQIETIDSFPFIRSPENIVFYIIFPTTNILYEKVFSRTYVFFLIFLVQYTHIRFPRWANIMKTEFLYNSISFI